MLTPSSSPVFYLPLDGLTAGFSAASAVSKPAGAGRSALHWFVGDDRNSALKVLLDLQRIDSWNWPIVLYGPPLSGKSVLGHALAGRLARGLSFQRGKNLRPMVGTARDWAYQLREAVDTNSVNEWLAKFISAGSVFLDDLLGLAESPHAQTQLVGLLDRLNSAGVPFIVTLSAAPEHAGDLTAALRSRLQAGLVLPVQLPGPAARREVLEVLSSQLGLRLDDSALDGLATSGWATDVVGLETMLRQLGAWANAEKIESPLTPPEIQRWFRQFRPLVSAATLPDLVIDVVADACCLDRRTLCGSGRQKSIVQARGIAMTMIRGLTALSFTAIGEFFSHRDHSTTMHSIQKTIHRLEAELFFQQLTERIFEKVRLRAACDRIPLLDSWTVLVEKLLVES